MEEEVHFHRKVIENSRVSVIKVNLTLEKVVASYLQQLPYKITIMMIRWLVNTKSKLRSYHKSELIQLKIPPQVVLDSYFKKLNQYKIAIK